MAATPARRAQPTRVAPASILTPLGIGDDHASIARVVLWVAVVLTLYTGAEYWREARVVR